MKKSKSASLCQISCAGEALCDLHVTILIKKAKKGTRQRQSENAVIWCFFLVEHRFLGRLSGIWCKRRSFWQGGLYVIIDVLKQIMT